MPESPTTKLLISVGPEVPEGFLDFHEGIRHAAPFVRPQHVNTNDDIMLMYFTSGTTGEPKMVAHDFTYPLGHISTGVLLAQPPRGQPAPHHCRHRVGEGRLGQVVRAVAGRGQHFRLRPREIYACRYPAQDRAVPDHLPVRAAHDLPLPDPRRPFEIRPFVARVLYDRGRGAPTEPVYDTFKRLTGVRLMEGFGQTETTLTLATFPWMEPKPGSMGVPNPQYDIDLLTPDGRSAEDGEQGKS